MDSPFRTRASAMMSPIIQDVRSSPSSSSSPLSSLPSSSFNGTRSRSADPRFSAGSFMYNVRIGIALVPGAIILLGMGGRPVLGTLTLGLMLSYILDSLHIKHGAFFGIWGSLFASQLALLFSGPSFSSMVSLPLYCLGILLSFELNFLIGVWASLQFRWLQMENPTVVLALERLLFACIPFAASAIQVWGIIASVGIVNSPFYLMVTLFEMYWLFSLPLQSSFKNKADKSYGGQIVEEALILGPLDATFHTLTLLFLPLLLYVGIHHAHILSSLNAICEVLLLFFVPLLFQLYCSTKGALWWIAKNPKQFRQVRLVNGAIALFVIVICLEVRVIFFSFGQYIHIPAPWSYLFVSIALLGGVLAMGAFGMGLIGDAFSSVILTGAMMLASLCASLVVGLPLKFFPAPLVSAFYISHFCMKKTLSSYFIFAVAATVPFAWFVVHNFWFLNVWLGGVMLKSICKLLIGSGALALAIPGLLLLPPKVRLLADLGLIGHAALVGQLESRLHNYSNNYFVGFEEDVVYPSYMVILTTSIGLLLVHRLLAENRIHTLTSCVLTCLYSAKLSILFLSTQHVLWETTVLLFAVCPPFLLYKDKLKGSSRMKPWQAFAHASAVCVAVWVCRYTLFESLQWTMGHPPSDGLILGSLICACAIGSTPIVTYHFSHVQAAKRALVLVAAIGICLILLQPPVPQAWTFWWDSNHTPRHLVDDMTIYGLHEQRPGWPVWLLVLAVVTSLAAVTSVIPVQYIVELRLLYAIGVGLCLGVYVCTQYFMHVPILHALFVAASLCFTTFLVFTHLPSTSSPSYMPWIFALLVALLPVMYFVEGQARLSIANVNGDEEEERSLALLAVEGSRAALLGIYASIFMVIALHIKYVLASLLKEKAMEKGRNWAQPSSSSGFAPKHRLLQQHSSITASLTVKKLTAEGSWMPAIGNIATGLCFVLCLILNAKFTGGSNLAIFVLAPILLLLNQDSSMLTGFGDRQRYFPVTLVISVYLVSAAVWKLWEEIWFSHQSGAWGLESGGPGIFFVVKNLLLLLLTIPNHALFNRFMWDSLKQPDMWLLLVTPLNFPPLVVTDLDTVRALSLLGIIYALVQYLVSRHIRIAGMKFI